MVYVISMVESYINEDDNPETVSNRLSVNVKQSKPIFRILQQQRCLEKH